MSPILRPFSRWVAAGSVAAVAGIAGCAPTSQGSEIPAAQCMATPRATSDIELIGWEPSQRSKLVSRSKDAAVAVRFETMGCDVQLEVLDCQAPDLKYGWQPSYSTETLTIRNTRELFAALPIGAAGLNARLQDGKALRTDFVLAGSRALSDLENIDPSQLQGRECARATHLVHALYVGGFAIAEGEGRNIDVGGSVFGVEIGAKTMKDRAVFKADGSAKDCDASKENHLLLPGCSSPLKIDLIPVQGRTEESCPTSFRWDSATQRCEPSGGTSPASPEYACATGYLDASGRCAPPPAECPAGSRRNPQGACESSTTPNRESLPKPTPPKPTPARPKPDARCPTGYSQDSAGRCVPATCSVWYVRRAAVNVPRRGIDAFGGMDMRLTVRNQTSNEQKTAQWRNATSHTVPVGLQAATGDVLSYSAWEDDNLTNDTHLGSASVRVPSGPGRKLGDVVDVVARDAESSARFSLECMSVESPTRQLPSN
jgi:hypothetical protein